LPFNWFVLETVRLMNKQTLATPMLKTAALASLVATSTSLKFDNNNSRFARHFGVRLTVNRMAFVEYAFATTAKAAFRMFCRQEPSWRCHWISWPIHRNRGFVSVPAIIVFPFSLLGWLPGFRQFRCLWPNQKLLLLANKWLIIRHSRSHPSSKWAGIHYASGSAMRVSVTVTTEFGQDEARRRTEQCTLRKKEDRAKKWAQTREKISTTLRKAITYAVVITAISLAFIHREELQRFIQQNYHRLVASRSSASNSGSLQQGAMHHEDEVNQASQ
jgi:hypothetical protein